MTLALSFNVAAMEPVKGFISKAAKSSQKKASAAEPKDKEKAKAKAEAEAEEKKNKIIEGKNRPTEFQKRGKSHISTGMARIICDGNFMYDTNDTYFEKVTFIGSKFYPAIFDTLNINDTWRGIKPVALIANSYKQCDFTKADMRNIEISKCYFELSNFSDANLSSA